MDDYMVVCMYVCMYIYTNWADNLMGVGENTFDDLFNELIFWKIQKIE
jgi:hypothetical protein